MRPPPLGPSRVLYVEQNTDGTVGGSYQCLYDLVRSVDPTRITPVVLFYQDNRYVAALRALGVEVHVVAPVPRPARRGSLPRRVARAASHVAARRAFLRRHRIDLVHLNNSPAVGVTDWLPAALLLGIPCITHARGGASPPRSAIERRLRARYRRVIAISRHVAAAVARDGVPPARVTQIYDGVDLYAFRAAATRDPAAVRAELGAAPDALLVAMVGHLRPWKGQLEVLRAVAALEPPHRARLRLVFAGATAPDESDYARRLHAAVDTLGLSDTVAFLGERTDVPDLMRAADVVVHASTEPEPFGLVVVQAMAMGRLVLASALGGPAEILTSDSGATFDPHDPAALAALLTRAQDDPAWRATLGAGATRRAEDFSLARNVAQIERLYAEIMSRAR